MANGSLVGMLAIIGVAGGLFFEDGRAVAAEDESPYTVTEVTVARGEGQQLYPAISGNIVVWTDQGVSWDSRDARLKAIDLSTGQAVAMPPGAGGQNRPAVSGSLVVWEDQRANPLSPCQWQPKVQLWAALNNEPAQPIAVGVQRR